MATGFGVIDLTEVLGDRGRLLGSTTTFGTTSEFFDLFKLRELNPNVSFNLLIYELLLFLRSILSILINLLSLVIIQLSSSHT